MKHSLAAVLALCLVSGVCLAQTPTSFTAPSVLAPFDGGRRVDQQGILANWYPPRSAPGQAAPTILLLGGSEGGIGAGAARQAKEFVDHGFAVLQLAYFGAPGLPTKLDQVPLEYFDRALAWLRQQPGVDAKRISIVGASKGAEAALLVASRNPDIHSVVVGAPSAAVWPGIDFTGGETGSSWTVGGKPLPYLRYGAGSGSIFEGYKSGFATFTSASAAAIPVKRIKASVLLVCGRADSLWPSCPMSEAVRSTMGAKAEVLAFDDAGHAVFGPPVPADSPALPSLAQLGGTAAGNNAARSAAWPKVLEFLAH